MTHYYLFIKAGTEINECTEFFKVAVGESDQQQHLRAWLSAYAYEHGCFFVIWTESAVEFLCACLASIGKDDRSLKLTKAEKLKWYLQTGEEVPANYQAELNRHHLLMQIDGEYYTNNVIGHKNK